MLRLSQRFPSADPQPLALAGLSPVLSQLLMQRGICTDADVHAFLSPSLEDLYDPFLLSDMDKAVQAVRFAMEARQAIAVYGDYDADGVCAAALIIQALRAHGAEAFAYIPSRHSEGYGLHQDALRSLKDKAGLVITVDCGITACEEARMAKALNIALVITDHHKPLAELPDCAAVVNPLLGDYPFPRLCGAGVALKLVHALFGEDALLTALPFAAVATVSDMVPLFSENRVIVTYGLKILNESPPPGLAALIEVAGLSKKPLTAGHLGFQIGPRLNAGGRLHEGGDTVQMLLATDMEEAKPNAVALQQANFDRQQLERDILSEATEWVMGNVDFLHERVIVVCGLGWHRGVVGLCASRLAERFGWPVVVLSQDGDTCVGSARSIPGVDLYQAMDTCRDLFIRFGGHTQAAGLTMQTEFVPILRERLSKAIAEIAAPDAFVPKAIYDLPMPLSQISDALLTDLSMLTPCGIGNPSPVFLSEAVEVLEARPVGKEEQHLKLRLAQGDTVLSGIAFSQGNRVLDREARVDCLYVPEKNVWEGRTSIQIQVSRLLTHDPMTAFVQQVMGDQDAFDLVIIQNPQSVSSRPDKAMLRTWLLQSLQGTMLTVRTAEGARCWVDWIRQEGFIDRVDCTFYKPESPQRFNALVALPAMGASSGYTRVIALDEALVPVRVQAITPSDADMRTLYKLLRSHGADSEIALSMQLSWSIGKVRVGLSALCEMGLVDHQVLPFRSTLRTATRCSLSDSATLTRLRAATTGQEVPA